MRKSVLRRHFSYRGSRVWISDTAIDKYLVLGGRKLAKTAKPILRSFPRREVFPSRRDQFSASAIQRARFAGSCLASCLHSAARELNWLVIGTPCLRVDLIPASLGHVLFSDYCPNGHCPNSHPTLRPNEVTQPAPTSRTTLPKSPGSWLLHFP
jgi:hypothetical protein